MKLTRFTNQRMPINNSARSTHQGRTASTRRFVGQHSHDQRDCSGLQQQSRQGGHRPDVIADADDGKRDNGCEYDSQSPGFTYRGQDKKSRWRQLQPPWPRPRRCRRLAASAFCVRSGHWALPAHNDRSNGLSTSNRTKLNAPGGEKYNSAKFDQPSHSIPAILIKSFIGSERLLSSPTIIPNARATLQALARPKADIASCAGR